MNATTYRKFFDTHFPMAFGGAKKAQLTDEERANRLIKRKQNAKIKYLEKKMLENPEYEPLADRRRHRNTALEECLSGQSEKNAYICNGLRLRKPKNPEEVLEKQRVRREIAKVIKATHVKDPNILPDNRFFKYLDEKRPEWIKALRTKANRNAPIMRLVARLNNKYNDEKRRAGIVGEGLLSPIKLFQKANNLYRKKMCHGKARELYEGELHAPCHNYTGPGTRMDLPNVYNYPPYNEIDNCSRLHDVAYDALFKMPNGKDKEKGIRHADELALECYNKHKNVQGYNWAYNGIKKKTQIEDNLPMLTRAIVGDYFGSK